ncbi:MAG: hypothetical protein Q8R24_02195 [Legionellaceae bacterium]|nr:hypothetical protein [Legionellaceae bacterium]
MSSYLSKFWGDFKSKNCEGAQKQFEELDDNEKQEIFQELFQKSEYHRRPLIVSVLRRQLYDDKSFGDFYQSWFPLAEMCNKIKRNGQVFQQHFPIPVRVINQRPWLFFNFEQLFPCYLFKMTEAPTQCAFKDIQQLEGKNAVILHRSEIYYANQRKPYVHKIKKTFDNREQYNSLIEEFTENRRLADNNALRASCKIAKTLITHQVR